MENGSGRGLHKPRPNPGMTFNRVERCSSTLLSLSIRYTVPLWKASCGCQNRLPFGQRNGHGYNNYY
jgi:hypothetical protein